MRTLLPLLGLLLTASAAQAGIPGMSKQEEIRLSCSICMGVVFVPVLIWLVVALVRHWLILRGTKPPKRERKFQPPRDD